MIIIDNQLTQRAQKNRPVRIGMAGAGFMGRGIVNQVANHSPGLKICGLFSRNPENAYKACVHAGMINVEIVDDLTAFERVAARGGCPIPIDANLLCQSSHIDVLIDATGSVEFGATFAQEAIRHGKDLILMNAELDGTIGPILKVHADQAGVMITGCDGDQPGVQMNLYRFIKSIGLVPLVCGNIKGMQDRYRNPTTQLQFAQQWGQTPEMVTSFADGTKISFEQAIVANATGMRVARRGMHGYHHLGHVDDLVHRYDIKDLLQEGGIVEYVVGSSPGPGVFILASSPDTRQTMYLDYGKLGDGPLYSFYVPYHLTVFEVPLSAARVALCRDAVITPHAGPKVDVIATAKTDLHAGEILDGLGGYKTYGQCENAEVVHNARLLPIGLAEGCRLTRSLTRDEIITYADVQMPPRRTVDALREQQDIHFFGRSANPLRSKPIQNHELSCEP